MSISISIVNRRTQGTPPDSRRAPGENACPYIRPRRRRIPGGGSLVLVVWLIVVIAAVVTATCQIRFVTCVITVALVGAGRPSPRQQRQLSHLLWDANAPKAALVAWSIIIHASRLLIPPGLSSNSGNSRLEEIYNPTSGDYARARARWRAHVRKLTKNPSCRWVHNPIRR